MGSNTSPMNDLVTLAFIEAAPAENQYGELAFKNTTPYRYVMYYGPPGSHGQVAEVEFYAGDTRLTGAGFGSEGSGGSRVSWSKALDGDPDTFFEGSQADANYVGIDTASGHVVAAPVATPAGGHFARPLSVTLSSATPGTAIRYVVGQEDPAQAGVRYQGAIHVGDGATTLRAVAQKPCMQDSDVTTAVFHVGERPPSVQASIHIGNSLTDTIDGWLGPLAASGGISLDYRRYTVPGAGTWLWDERPSGGFGVPDIRVELGKRSFDHISFQPSSNMPCLPIGPGDAKSRSDAAYIHEAWRTAMTRSPAARIWVYQAWPPPVDYSNCITGGGWLRDPRIWRPPAPRSWDEAVQNELRYVEVVRDELARLEPTRPSPRIIPAGKALASLKREIEAGRAPGMDAFFPVVFTQAGKDPHLTPEGRYFVTLVFYAAMFQKDPRGLPQARTSLTEAQAATFQRVVWETVTTYPQSGWSR